MNYREHKKRKNIAMWTKMSTMCTQIKNFVDKKVRMIIKNHHTNRPQDCYEEDDGMFRFENVVK